VDIAIIQVSQQGRQPLYVVLDGTLEIGRECDGLLLGDPEVSRRHVVLVQTAHGVTVEDLASRNGTTVDGRPATGPTEMKPGQVARLGATDLTLLAGGASLTSHQTIQRGAGGAPGTVMSTAAPVAAAPLPAPSDVVVGSAVANSDPRMTSIEVVARSVDSSRDKLADIRAEGDTVTIVFSDIESSTEQAMKMGVQKWFDVLGIHNDIVRRNVTAYGGTEIKSQGDGFMLTFPSARKAVQCCISVQQELDVHARRSPDTGVRIRIGLHTGEAIVDDDGDLFGKHIIIAARVANLAEGGQILASGIVRDIVSSRGDIDFGAAETVTLKGIDGTFSVHPVVWQD
jgi:adenylate cyclase